MALKDYKLGQSYAFVNLRQIGDKKRYEFLGHGNQFLLGKTAIHIYDIRKNTDHWFILNSYNTSTGAFYKYVYKN